jgi:hypothetical protein
MVIVGLAADGIQGRRGRLMLGQDERDERDEEQQEELHLDWRFAAKQKRGMAFRGLDGEKESGL